MIVVCDTSAITNLAAVEHLHLLEALYDEVIIPEAVFRELVDAPQPVPGASEAEDFGWIKVKAVTNTELVEQLGNSLDAGEAEAIALAVELRAGLLVLDERTGHWIATNLKLRVIGILGVLLAAKANGLIPAVQPLLDRLIGQAGFWVSRAVYRRVLQLAQED